MLEHVGTSQPNAQPQNDYFMASFVTFHSAKSLNFSLSIAFFFAFSRKVEVLFTPSLGRAQRPCRGLEKYFPPDLQRCYGCSFDAQEIVHTGHGMLGFFSFFSFGEKGACPK